MADLHDKFFPYDDMNVTVLKALARLNLSVSECEELLELDSHALMVEHELDHVQTDTVRMWTQHEFQRHSAASVTGASAKGAANLRDMSKWQPARTYPIKEGNMKRIKVTSPTQLRKILKAVARPKPSLLRETIADAQTFEARIDEMASEVSDMFGEDMMKLFAEDPEIFQGRSSESDWQEQVTYAQQELDTGIASAIAEKIEEIETMLHDGQYQR
jgi:hypothetical protein